MAKKILVSLLDSSKRPAPAAYPPTTISVCPAACPVIFAKVPMLSRTENAAIDEVPHCAMVAIITIFPN